MYIIFKVNKMMNCVLFLSYDFRAKVCMEHLCLRINVNVKRFSLEVSTFLTILTSLLAIFQVKYLET